MNPLIVAAKNGDVAEIARIHDSGADIISCRNPEGMSAILIASRCGHLDLLNYLLENGADPNDAEYYGGTCLMAAACYRNVDCTRRLIEAGADIRYAYPADNATVVYMVALCFAGDFKEQGEKFTFREGSVIRIVKLLLDAGAPGHAMQREDEKSKTALQVLQGMQVAGVGAVQREREGLIDLLQEHIDS